VHDFASPRDATIRARKEFNMSKSHIFCVNGDPVFLELVQQLLEENYAVTVTTFVPETFEQISVLGPDLIIVDLEVTTREGFFLLERLARDAKLRDVPVLALSTMPHLLEEAHEIRYSVDRYLDKPFEVDEFLANVACLLG
jgi:DNA-binding response OmpR family regulator